MGLVLREPLHSMRRLQLLDVPLVDHLSTVLELTVLVCIDA